MGEVGSSKCPNSYTRKLCRWSEKPRRSTGLPKVLEMIGINTLAQLNLPNTTNSLLTLPEPVVFNCGYCLWPSARRLEHNLSNSFERCLKWHRSLGSCPGASPPAPDPTAMTSLKFASRIAAVQRLPFIDSRPLILPLSAYSHQRRQACTSNRQRWPQNEKPDPDARTWENNERGGTAI